MHFSLVLEVKQDYIVVREAIKEEGSLDDRERLAKLEAEVERLSREKNTKSERKRFFFMSGLEWAMVAALISVALITGASSLGNALNSQFENLSQKLNEVDQ